MAAEARDAAAFSGALILNRRADLALAARADGVQLPASGFPVAAVRHAFGIDLLIGRSTHSIEEVRRAREEGADFVLFGPVFDTPSKRGRIPARGTATLADAVACGLPVLAIGGIDESNAPDVVESGVWGLAAIRWFADPSAGRPHFESLLRTWCES